MKKFIILIFILILAVIPVCFAGCNEKNNEDNIYGIYVSKSPDKVLYYAGENLDITGCEITVRTKSKNDYTVKVTPSMVSGFSSALGNHTLTITYVVGNSSFLTTQVITVTTRVANSAVITVPPQNTTFVEGQRIDLSGLIAEVTFSDKTVADRHFGAFTMNKTVAELGMEEVELKLDKAVIKVNITVIPKVLAGLKITSLPTKTVYNEGDIFDPSGMVIHSVFNDGTNASLVDFEVDNEYVPLVASQKFVTIRDKYSRDLTLEIPITVNVLEISSIELLNRDEIRTAYLVSSLPDYTTVTAKIVFQDNTEAIVDYTNLIFNIPSDKPLTVGEHTIEVKYKYASTSEKSDSFVISVVEEKLPIGIRVETKKNFNSLYVDGEAISLLGLNVYVIFNDSTEDWLIYGNEKNTQIDGFEMTEFADINNPYIEFKIGEIVERIDINVSVDESEYDAPEK